MPHTNCKRCGKELTDPVSVLRGIGPECWKKRILGDRNEKTLNLFGNRAEYTWGFDGNILWLKDHGKTCRSLTNDLENCLAEIQAEIDQPINAYKIIYRDSEGDWDGVTLQEFNLEAVLRDALWLESGQAPSYFAQGLHIDFYYIGEKTYEAAKQKAIAH